MKQKLVKRIARAMLPCFVFFVFSFSLAPKAQAVVFNGDANFGIATYSLEASNQTWTSTAQLSLPVVNGFAPASGLYSVFLRTYWDFYFFTMPTQEFNSVTKLYCSYFYVPANTSPNVAMQATRTEDYLDNDAWQVSYINSMGQTGYVEGGLDSISEFSPSASSVVGGKGYAIEQTWQGSDGLPIRSLMIRRAPNSRIGFYNSSTSAAASVVVNIPSARIITTEYTAEMEGLDRVADEIAAQSDILLAMKGDLVAILQDIYQMTGDMYIAQNLLNGYVQQMLPLLESINTQSINIYNLLSSQLRALETAIETAATSIEAAISAQTAAMIAYLESMLNTGNEVPDDTYQQQQDAANILDQMESLEKPNVDTIVPEIGDYTDSGVSGVLSAIFSSNLIVTMMTLSASFAFGAYVLFGKRE